VDRAEGKPENAPRARVKGDAPRARVDAREDEDELDGDDEPARAAARPKRRG
jgi:hypothetical protein